MKEEALPPGFVVEDPLPAGFQLESGPPQQPDSSHPAGALGEALYNAIAHAVKAANPFQAGPVTEAATAFGKAGAPGAVAGMTGKDLPKDAPIPAQIGRMVADPAVLGNLAAATATGGASIPVQAGMAALATGSGRALQEGVRQAISGEDNTGAVLGEGAKAGAIAGALQGAIGVGSKAFEAAKPALKKLGAQMIRATSGVPEKYGAAVLEKPEILSNARTIMGAREVYKAAVKDMGGVRDFLQEQTGKILPSQGDVMTLINGAVPKIADKSLGLEEALAARQGVAHLLEQAKFGNPEQRANKAALLGVKNELDTYLETGLPGFKKANLGYFEANAKEAFNSWLPQNKNLSPNVLRSLGALSSLSAGALLRAPELLLAATPMSPKVTGYMIRAGAAGGPTAAISAAFLARVAAARATQGGPTK